MKSYEFARHHFILDAYTARTPNGRPYEKDVGLYEFAETEAIMEACTAREANSLPYNSEAKKLPVKFQFPGLLRKGDKHIVFFGEMRYNRENRRRSGMLL